MSIRIIEKESGRTIGEASEEDLSILIGHMEEEHSTDQDYYVEHLAIEQLELLGASNHFVQLLKDAVGSSEGVDIVWARE